MSESTPLTKELLDRAEQAMRDDHSYEPYCFIGTVEQCKWYGKHILGWTDDQIDQWVQGSGR